MSSENGVEKLNNMRKIKVDTPENSKMVSIAIPESMDKKTAQSCFVMGLKTMLSMYNGAVVVSYATQNGKEDGIQSLAVHDVEGAAIIKFTKTILKHNHKPLDEKLQEITNAGNEILEKITPCK